MGIVIGFLLGTRARQLISATKNVAKATMTLKDLMKMSVQSRPEPADEAEAVEEEEKEAEEPGELLEQFMSTEATSGLDDHPDTVLSPIIMYHVKAAKDEARRQKRKQALMVEGMTDEEAERLLLDEAAGGMFGGAVNGDGTRLNALATLIAVGARVTSAGNAQSAEAAAAEERRRHARTINTFLEKQRGIDTSKTQPLKSTTRKNAADALETAMQTKAKPYGGDRVRRAADAADNAKNGRVMLRNLQEARNRAGIITPGTEVEMKRREAGVGGAGLLSSRDQAALLAELMDEEDDEDLAGLMGDEYDEGEEGEEGQDGVAA